MPFIFISCHYKLCSPFFSLCLTCLTLPGVFFFSPVSPWAAIIVGRQPATTWRMSTMGATILLSCHRPPSCHHSQYQHQSSAGLNSTRLTSQDSTKIGPLSLVPPVRSFNFFILFNSPGLCSILTLLSSAGLIERYLQVECSITVLWVSTVVPLHQVY